MRKLSKLYSHVDDVDLFVGGFLEENDGDSILGPTFRCIIGDTFARYGLNTNFHSLINFTNYFNKAYFNFGNNNSIIFIFNLG